MKESAHQWASDWEKALDAKARLVTKTNVSHAFSFMLISQSFSSPSTLDRLLTRLSEDAHGRTFPIGLCVIRTGAIVKRWSSSYRYNRAVIVLLVRMRIGCYR